MAIKTSETATVVNPCLDWLELMGVMAWRNNTGAMVRTYKGRTRLIRFGCPGMSDIAGIMPGGRALYIECKPPGEGPSDDQELFLTAVKAKGAVGLVVHSLEELIEQMESVLR